ncbi:NADH-flavin reductase [Sorangium cellulosum]|uniref:NADH-flavin reductase n=1 Tax=Sorangium cellulosum TaxID=56 RepID=A0A4P2QF18_SORCE|nr:SDR family oxidoreductase [Sorangium cellulosum]AUX27793.1 NADH-flavin reductase [Sorangium cellulosum]
MSRLLVLGATGGTGAALIRQALEAGHEVSAFARDPSAIPVPHHERLRALRGDIMDGEQVSRAVAGHDAVLSALGARGLGPTRVYSGGAGNILRAMKEHGVRRLIAVTAAGLCANLRGALWFRLLVKPLLRNAYSDMERMEEAVRNSDVDWTLVRPPRLTDGRLTGQYRVSVDLMPPGNYLFASPVLSRDDVAHFMLAQLENDEYLRKTVVVTY